MPERLQNGLRLRRAEQRVSQQALSFELGLSLNRLWRIENGYTEPTAEERAALAGALDTTEAELFPAAASASEVAS